jgi:NTP pyrophosphatase (non-canonical NTP hydrolase)
MKMTTIKQSQDWVKEAWKKAPKQVTEKDELLFLLEEIGEMAECLRKINGNKNNKQFEADLEKELGDILLCLFTLAIRYDINMEGAFQKTQESILGRYII